MTFAQALDETPQTGRAMRCRICQLIDTLPEPDATDLATAMRPESGIGPKRLTEALALEGYPDMYHSVKHHRYICVGRP